MRHRKTGRKLNRNSSHREAMLCNLLNSLVKSERIQTTLGRAKELQKVAERAITFAKRGTMASIVQLTKIVKSEREEVIAKLLKDLGPRFAGRAGGYTRIVKLGFRRGDAAQTAIIEYLSADEPLKKKTKKRSSKKSETAPAETVAETAPAEIAAETAPAETAAETAPAETAAETVPAETAAETAPAETAAETAPAETVAETAPAETAAETVPAETAAETASAETASEKADSDKVSEG